MFYRTYRLPWTSSFLRSGSCCVSNNPRGSSSLCYQHKRTLSEHRNRGSAQLGLLRTLICLLLLLSFAGM